MSLFGFVRAVHAVAVHRAGAYAFDIAVPDLVGVLGELDALVLALAAGIEQAQLDAGGVRGEQGEVDAFAVPGCTAWVRRTFAQSKSGGHRQRSRPGSPA